MYFLNRLSTSSLLDSTALFDASLPAFNGAIYGAIPFSMSASAIQPVQSYDKDDVQYAVINGTPGDDNLIGTAAADTISGLDGNDTIEGGEGADTIDGGAGVDTVSYASSAAGVAVNLEASIYSGGDAAGDTIANVENIIGSAFGDNLVGTSGATQINAGDGDDTLHGLGGAKSAFWRSRK